MKRTYIIAEAGINHNGDIEIAKKLIDMAVLAGCDAVKFQKRNPDVCVPEAQKSVMKSTPWGDMTYLEYKHKIEFGKTEYDIIDAYCKEKGIDWSASVWDLDSLEFIRKYDVPFIKIPSALALDKTLVTAAHNTGKQVIISTGMCDQLEVNTIIDAVGEMVKFNRSRNAWVHRGDGEYTLAPPPVVMHTNSTYPAKVESLNLSYIQHLQEQLERVSYTGECEVGYSGHEFGIIPTLAAVCYGATYIERHITIDRAMWGTDQQSSLGPKGLIELVDGIREIEKSFGTNSPDRIITDDERIVRNKLRGY